MEVRSRGAATSCRAAAILRAGIAPNDCSTLSCSMSSIPARVRIATRVSRLAMTQTEMVAAALRERHPGLAVEIVGMTTKGDRVLDRPLAQVGGKGLFVKELEVAMEEDRADLAVHTLKDVPMVLPARVAIGTFGEREVPVDAFVSNLYGALAELPAGA